MRRLMGTFRQRLSQTFAQLRNEIRLLLALASRGLRAVLMWIVSEPIAGATLLLAVSTVALAVESQRQIAISTVQLSTLQDQLNATLADQRPWVSAVTTQDSIRMIDWNGNKGVGIFLTFRLHNYGRLPAQELYVNTMIAPRLDNAHLNQLDGPQEALCVNALHTSVSQRVSTVVFPGQDAAADGNVSINSQFSNHSRILYEVYGCIDYMYASGQHGQTLFRYILGKIDRDIWIGIPFKKGRTVPIANPVGPISIATLDKRDYDLRVDSGGGNYVR
jgi:hypothetical protein